MNVEEIKSILDAVSSGNVTAEAASEQIKNLSFEDVGYAKIDHGRATRQGFPEVVFGQGKTREQIVQAFSYPVVVMLAAMGVGAYMVRSVFPVIMKFIASGVQVSPGMIRSPSSIVGMKLAQPCLVTTIAPQALPSRTALYQLQPLT